MGGSVFGIDNTKIGQLDKDTTAQLKKRFDNPKYTFHVKVGDVPSDVDRGMETSVEFTIHKRRRKLQNRQSRKRSFQEPVFSESLPPRKRSSRAKYATGKYAQMQ